MGSKQHELEHAINLAHALTSACDGLGLRRLANSAERIAVELAQELDKPEPTQ